MTVRLGGAFLYDYAGYSQDEDSKTQLALESKGSVRDSRIILSGSFPKVSGLTYTFGYMFDGANDDWKVDGKLRGVTIEPKGGMEEQIAAAMRPML